MNWFTEYFQHQLDGGGWISELSLSLPIQLLLFSLIIGVSLFKYKTLKTSVFCFSALATGMLIYFDPQPTLEFLATGTRLDGITLDTALVMFAMIVGPVLLILSFRKKFRTIDRMMIGILLTSASFLMFGYHMLLINGMLRYDLHQQENHLMSVIKLDNRSFETTCRALHLDCRSGAQTENLEYSINSELKRQVNDFLKFYRENRQEPLIFSDSNALISKKYPYAYAYVETGSQYRWVIDTDLPRKTSLAYQAAFSLISHAIIIFWTVSMMLALFMHNVMFQLRKEQARERALAQSTTLTQSLDGC